MCICNTIFSVTASIRPTIFYYPKYCTYTVRNTIIQLNQVYRMYSNTISLLCYRLRLRLRWLRRPYQPCRLWTSSRKGFYTFYPLLYTLPLTKMYIMKSVYLRLPFSDFQAGLGTGFFPVQNVPFF